MQNILIIEDDAAFSNLLQRFLQKNDFATKAVGSVKEATNTIGESDFDLILLDYRLPDGTGMDILQKLTQSNRPIPAIVMTSFHDIRTAVKTVRSGAYDYITKPVNPDELLMVINELLLQQKKAQKEMKAMPAQFIEGNSTVSQKIHEYIRLVAPTELSVIIQGDSGTGKEQVAKNIHQLSKRSSGPFVAIDCGALSADLAGSELFGHVKGAFTGALQNKKGQFEAANGGTLFLDEVGNLSYEIQVKLLRALQERVIQPVGGNQSIKVNVRIITATNDDLLNSVKNGRFREDLYHRLNEFKIDLPSLKERSEDLPSFIDHFIQQANKELNKDVKGVDKEVKQIFYNYDWPGNLRELKNIIKRAVLLCKSSLLSINDLPVEMGMAVSQKNDVSDSGLRTIQEANEKELILKALKDVKYNKSKAAKLLNIDRTTLYYKMAKYNIE